MTLRPRVAALCLVVLYLGAESPAIAKTSGLDSLPTPTDTIGIAQSVSVPEGSRTNGRSWTTGLTFEQHVRLVLLAALLGLVFTGVQKWAGYEIDRNRRHHRAIAQLEYILGRRFHRLTQNVTRIERLCAVLREGKLGAMFPDPFEPDDAPCIELLNVDLINGVLRVNERMEGIDFNLTSFRTAYEKVRDDFARDPTNAARRDAYERNTLPMANQYETLREEVCAMREELIRVLAWLKILGKRDKPGVRRFMSGRSRVSAKVSDEEIGAMVREIERLAAGPHRFRKTRADSGVNHPGQPSSPS